MNLNVLYINSIFMHLLCPRSLCCRTGAIQMHPRFSLLSKRGTTKSSNLILPCDWKCVENRPFKAFQTYGRGSVLNVFTSISSFCRAQRHPHEIISAWWPLHQLLCEAREAQLSRKKRQKVSGKSKHRLVHYVQASTVQLSTVNFCWDS